MQMELLSLIALAFNIFQSLCVCSIVEFETLKIHSRPDWLKTNPIRTESVRITQGAWGSSVRCVLFPYCTAISLGVCSTAGNLFGKSFN